MYLIFGKLARGARKFYKEDLTDTVCQIAIYLAI